MKSPTKGAIAGAALGVIFMFGIMESSVSFPSRWMLLWPAAILAFGYNGQGGIDGLFVWTVEIGSQMLVFGAIGFVLGSLLQRARREG